MYHFQVDAIPETVVAKNPTPVESTQPSPQTPPLQKKATSEDFCF